MARKNFLATLADNIATRWLQEPGTGDSTFRRALSDYVRQHMPAGYCRSDIVAATVAMVRDRIDDMDERDRLLAAARRRHGH